LVGKPERKNEPLGRPRHRWMDIKMGFWEIVCDGMDWIDLAQDTGQWIALVNTVMNLRVPQIAGSWVATQPAASQEGLSSMKLVSTITKIAVPHTVAGPYQDVGWQAYLHLQYAVKYSCTVTKNVAKSFAGSSYIFRKQLY
jgi:hypothetical protein